MDFYRCERTNVGLNLFACQAAMPVTGVTRVHSRPFIDECHQVDGQPHRYVLPGGLVQGHASQDAELRTFNPQVPKLAMTWPPAH